MSKTVLVTGASGRTGRPVVEALVARGAKVRGLVRKTDQAENLRRLGAEAAIGDLENPASLIAACDECDTIMHIGPPMYAREIEATIDLLRAGAHVGASHFIYYSVMHPLRQDVFHHRQKLHAEAHVVESGLPYTILQPTRYMQHLAPVWARVRDDGIHAMPFSTKARFNIVDLRDLAEVCAIVTTEPGHLYASYELCGPEALTSDDMAEILAEALGHTVVAKTISPDEAMASARAKGFDEERIARMMTMNAHYDKYGFLGNPNILRWLLGRPPHTFREYVHDLMTGRTQ